MAFRYPQAPRQAVRRETVSVVPVVVDVAAVADVVRVRAAVVETPAEAHLRVAAIAKQHSADVSKRVALRRGPFVLPGTRTS
jgi:hypothetical protein